MSVSITVFQREIKAVAYAMAEKDLRYYLNGVCVETNGADIQLTATDGSIVMTLRSEYKGGGLITQQPTEYIIPASLVKTIIKAKAGRSSFKPVVSLIFDGNRVEAALPDGTSAIAKLVDGAFPDWRRIIPTGDLGETVAASFNADYLKAASAAALLVAGKFHAFKQRGQQLAIMRAGALTVGLMPLRDHAVQIAQSCEPGDYLMQAPDVAAQAAA